MLYKIVNNFPNNIIFQNDGPFVWFFQRTHRFSSDNQHDPIVLKNLLREIELSLQDKIDTGIIEKIIRPFYDINRDINFWNNSLDDFALENYSPKSKLPLILVVLKEYHSHFKQLSNNPYIFKDEIDSPMKSHKLNEIEQSIRVIIMEVNVEKIKKLTGSFIKAEMDSLSSLDLDEVATAALEGGVETIFVEEDKLVSGILNMETGKIELGDLNTLDNEDIFNSLSGLVILSGGSAVILTKEKMPGNSGVVALFRYN